MKIMQIIPAFNLAGAEIMCENLVYELINHGHEVHVISLYTKHTAITDRLESSGVSITYLDKKSGFDPSIFFKLIKAFKKHKPDIIHTHLYVTIYAIAAAVLAGVKHKVHTIHNIAEKESTKTVRKFNSIFYKFFKTYPVAISPQVKKTVQELYNIPSSKIGMVYNGIDLNKCIPKDDYATGNTIEIVHVGRFTKQKNHSTIIKAFDLVYRSRPNARLSFYGKGELQKECEALVSELSLNGIVSFCGTTGNIYDVMHNSDIFLLCSSHEGMPITVIEAMGTGLPIVATPVGGIVDMLKDSDDALFAMNDEKDISDKILCMIDDAQLRQKCGSNALKHSDRFSAKEMANGYIQIYNDLFNNR